MERSTETHARELAEAVLRITDAILEKGTNGWDSHEVSSLISLRVRARDVLEHLPQMTEEERRLAALRIERWGRLGQGRRVQGP